MSEMNAVDTLYCHGRIMSAEGFPCVNCPDFDPRKGCALVGSPNVPYWKSIGVSFTKSFNLDGIIEHNEANNWSKLDHHKIIALPASFMRFPSTNAVNYVHKSLVFVDEIKTIGDKGKCNLTFMQYSIIYTQLFVPAFDKTSSVAQKLGRFTSIHLRNGPDWIKACNLIKRHNMKQLFSSSQCHMPEIQYHHCYQTIDQIISFLKKNSPNEKVFISSDYENHRESLSKYFEVFTLEDIINNFSKLNRPFIELYIHSISNLFIANCPSSFSAFSVRQRSQNNLKTLFWGVENNSHTEL